MAGVEARRVWLLGYPNGGVNRYLLDVAEAVHPACSSRKGLCLSSELVSNLLCFVPRYSSTASERKNSTLTPRGNSEVKETTRGISVNGNFQKMLKIFPQGQGYNCSGTLRERKARQNFHVGRYFHSPA